MLYFSETEYTLPNMDEINHTFERKYNVEAYEQKITSLIRNYQTRISKVDPEAFASWKQAIAALRKEDHYILLLIDAADGKLPQSIPLQQKSDRLLKLIAFGIAGGCIALLFLFVILRIAER